MEHLESMFDDSLFDDMPRHQRCQPDYVFGAMLAQLELSMPSNRSGEADEIAKRLREFGWWKDFRNPFQTLPGEHFWFSPDIWLVALDETEEWRSDLQMPYRQHLRSIERVWWLDFSQQTHIASTKASYYMHPLYHRVNLALDNTMSHQRYNEVNEAISDYVESSLGSSQYFGANRINQLLALFLDGEFADKVAYVGNPGYDFNELDGESDRDKYDGSFTDTVQESLLANRLL